MCNVSRAILAALLAAAADVLLLIETRLSRRCFDPEIFAALWATDDVPTPSQHLPGRDSVAAFRALRGQFKVGQFQFQHAADPKGRRLVKDMLPKFSSESYTPASQILQVRACTSAFCFATFMLRL